MNAKVLPYVPCCCFVRRLGRTSALLLFGLWAVLFVREGATLGIQLSPNIYVQGFCLALVFWGYFLSWKHEVLGSVISIAAVLGLFAASWIVAGAIPQVMLLLFALPSLLILLSRWMETHLPHDHHPQIP